MPGEADDMKVKAQLVLEINTSHPIAEKVKSLYDSDKETLKEYAKLIYNNARLASGLSVEDTAEFSKLLAKYLAK